MNGAVQREAQGPPRAVVVYDGACGACDRFVRFAARWNDGSIVFASSLAPQVVAWLDERGLTAEVNATVLVVTEKGILRRTAAVARVLRGMGSGWSLLASLSPRSIVDAGYDAFARNRSRFFAAPNTCALLGKKEKAAFLSGEALADVLRNLEGR
jgi:predicted DCC family thiol-disulfide oxidoreductase YuxK